MIKNGSNPFMAQPQCKHRKLVLLPPQSAKLRCTRCHLTIEEEELAANNCCPECLAAHSIRHRDFERVEPEADRVRYSCEDCGAVIITPNPDVSN
ncbi:MAG: hypothetical protein CVU64_07725 [Deltaproteobacteria bacterium HGW-Deltaproteobacteria-21]|nr:MAG: hypothetical protein CVU64_07725 [Deltaproteobacteria bacterium HGW-Deltaproteobacteria-21]